jgi:hypothetical protein
MESAFMKFLKGTIAVENGFLAAGATVAGVAFVQSIATLLSWLH